MVDHSDNPNATHLAFPYFFDTSDGIHFGDLQGIQVNVYHKPDLYIYYDSLEGDDYTNSWCSRWDTQDYSVIVETWLTESDLQSIKDHTRVGAVTELYKLIERPVYFDSTFSAKNTIRIVPNISSTSTLKHMRRETVIFPKNITTSPIEGAEGWMNVKIEGLVSGLSTL